MQISKKFAFTAMGVFGAGLVYAADQTILGSSFLVIGRMRRRIVVALLLAGVTAWMAGDAGASVLCQKKSGATFVRDACRKRETPVDVSALLGTLPSTVSSLQSSVNTLQSDVSTLPSTLSSLQSSVNTLQSDVNTLPSTLSSLQSSVNTLQSDVTGLMNMSRAPEPADQRFSVMWQVSGGVHHVAVRADGSIRDTDDNNVVVNHVTVGQWCITAPGALEGAVGVMQNDGSGPALILVSMGIGSFCNSVVGSNITVETFRF